MSPYIPPRPSATRRSAPSTARRLATAAIAFVVTVGLTVFLDPFGVRASVLDPTLAAAAIGVETVVGFLLIDPFVGLCLDLTDAWGRSATPGGRGSGDGGGDFGFWGSSDGDSCGDGGGDGGGCGD